MRDLFDVLTDSGQRKDAAPQFLETLMKNPPMLGALIGGAVGAIGQYASSKPSKKTGISAEQRLYRRAERVAEFIADQHAVLALKGGDDGLHAARRCRPAPGTGRGEC